MNFYPLTIEMDDNQTWFVTSPDYPEVTTFADTIDDALVSGLKAIEEAMAARIRDKQNLPAPRTDAACGSHGVRLPMHTFLKAALYMICREEGVSRAELARRMNVHRETVDRLFRLDHESRLNQLEDAFEALGHPLTFAPRNDPWGQAA